nr:hypothetical protein [Tanacetum cinerariifolium]
YVEFLEKNLISQEVSGRAGELEEIQVEDTSPSGNTSKIHVEFEGKQDDSFFNAPPLCSGVRHHPLPVYLIIKPNSGITSITIGELHALLIEYEKGLPKKAATPLVMAIQEHMAKDDACHHCKEVGYCKRNCHAYLGELIKKKKQVGTTSSSGLKGVRKLKQEALYLYVGNGVHAKVEATAKDDACHHCKEVGHCKRNCPAYIAVLI